MENIENIKKRHLQSFSFFESLANYAPAFGLLGTVIGLIKLLANLQSPEQLGQGMAIAMVTTFYGLALANLLFLPISGRLRLLSFQEILQKEMLLVGVVSISNNESSYVVKEKMQMFLSKQERKALWKK